MTGLAQTQTLAHDALHPEAFTQEQLGWLPWLEPFPAHELTDRHHEGLVDRGRANSDYFRLLVRDPEILGARTRTDKDIFYNVDGGLPREERELAAAAASRVNGCVFCASVHARFAAELLNLFNPCFGHGSRRGAALAADNRPINACQIRARHRTDERLERDKADGAGGSTEIVDAMEHRRILDARSNPYVRKSHKAGRG